MDDTVPHLLRLMLSHLMVAMMSIALVSTSWHGVAQAGSPEPAVHVHDANGVHKRAVHSRAEHTPSAPVTAHASGQGCCHPACTVAVIPLPAGVAEALPLSAPLQMSHDLVPAPTTPSALDRPPKFA